MREKDRKERIDEMFKKELDRISLENTPISGFKPSIRRVTKAIRKHSLWPRIKEDIRTTPLEDDRRRMEHE
jgi:hypothetical protein